MTQQSPTITRLAEAGAAQTSHTRVEALPTEFRTAFSAFESYLADRRVAAEVDAIAAALDDLVILFTEAADDGIPLRAVVGTDPAQVAEALLANHADVSCDASARADLTRAIDAVVG